MMETIGYLLVFVGGTLFSILFDTGIFDWRFWVISLSLTFGTMLAALN